MFNDLYKYLSFSLTYRFYMYALFPGSLQLPGRAKFHVNWDLRQKFKLHSLTSLKSYTKLTLIDISEKKIMIGIYYAYAFSFFCFFSHYY